MKPKLIAQGAEAKVYVEIQNTYSMKPIVAKKRIPKSYRHPILDEQIRKQRTRREAKILIKASKSGVNVPKVLSVNQKGESSEKYNLIIEYLEGEKLADSLNGYPESKQKEIMKKLGKQTALMHENDIIHGDLTTSNVIFEGSITDKANGKFIKLLNKVKELNLPKDQYAIFGSGPMAIRRLRESDDIDIIVKKELWEKLSAENKLVKKENYGDHFKINGIEIFCDWLPWIKNSSKLVEDSEIIEDLPFVKLKYLVAWKEKDDRPKHADKSKKDLKLIKEYLAKSKTPEKVYIIDFGLGFISPKIEDKAVDLHLIKQALEAKHWQDWEELFKSFLGGYKYDEAKKVVERLEVVEKRGRYKH